MLVIRRKLNERIQIGDDIVITFIRLESDGRGGRQVRLGIDAPRDLDISRLPASPPPEKARKL